MEESPVHCHGGCEFDPRHCTLFVFIDLYYLSICRYNCLNIIKPFRLLNITLMTANNAYHTESMHSVASRKCVFAFNNVPFDDQTPLYKC